MKIFLSCFKNIYFVHTILFYKSDLVFKNGHFKMSKNQKLKYFSKKTSKKSGLTIMLTKSFLYKNICDCNFFHFL